MAKMIPRPYQLGAINSCVQHFQRQCKNHAVCILPTGAGKSLVIACVAEQLEGNILILQPSKEILEQNIAKYRATGNEATIYSAILGEKIISKVVFATIGSVINNFKAFEIFKQVIIDECHTVNSKGGMYDFFLNNIKDIVCVGLTATPYRLRSQGKVSVIEFLTRIVPSFYKQVIHVTQQKELKDAGFLSEIIYKRKNDINLDNLIVKGQDYEESSLRKEYDRIDISDLIIQEIEELEKTRKSILVFTEFTEISNKIMRKRPDILNVTGMTNTHIRAQILDDFKKGIVRILLNVGVLTTGFDFPELDSIIVAKATRSLSLWYQIIGRGQRIAAGKKNCLVVDMCNNLQVLGDVQKLEIAEENGKWIVKQGFRQISNKAF
jgi:DNA repair protein RadD